MVVGVPETGEDSKEGHAKHDTMRSVTWKVIISRYRKVWYRDRRRLCCLGACVMD